MNPEEHSFVTQRTARYYQLGETSDKVTDLWVVLHGYGQMAGFFIRHFEGIKDEHNLVVAPEALSRFYLDGTFGRVGASWMTREDRFAEIADQVQYLDTLVAHLKSRISNPELRLHVLGFSQGVATAWRWLQQGQTPADSLILWAGRAPDEQQEGFLSQTRFFVVLGNEDPYILPGAAEQELAVLQQRFPHLKRFIFQGKHEMHAETLKKIKALI